MLRVFLCINLVFFAIFRGKSVLFNGKQFGVRVFRIFRGYQIWLAFFIRRVWLARFSMIFPGIRGIPAIRGQILKKPMVIKPSNQPKPALSLT